MTRGRALFAAAVALSAVGGWVIYHGDLAWTIATVALCVGGMGLGYAYAYGHEPPQPRHLHLRMSEHDARDMGLDDDPEGRAMYEDVLNRALRGETVVGTRHEDGTSDVHTITKGDS